MITNFRAGRGRSARLAAAVVLVATALGGCVQGGSRGASAPGDGYGATTAPSPVYQDPDPYHLHQNNMQAG